VSSTNEIAKELAMSGASEDSASSRASDGGAWTPGSLWSSPRGEGFLSLILRPQVKVSESALITIAAAIAVAETLRLDFQTDGDIKWPNDILAKGRKICGILVESAVEGDRLQYAIMGIGVNLTQRSFPDQIGDAATSILLETGREISPEDFVEAMLPRLELWYAASLAESDRVIARWGELSSSGYDCLVRVESSDDSVEGLTRGLTATGALIVELANGERREIVSGEVKVRSVPA
jgi:BirA family biotin operon repressor/biotin-[acetyl-CoA-carboxylase] ligase